MQMNEPVLWHTRIQKVEADTDAFRIAFEVFVVVLLAIGDGWLLMNVLGIVA